MSFIHCNKYNKKLSNNVKVFYKLPQDINNIKKLSHKYNERVVNTEKDYEIIKEIYSYQYTTVFKALNIKENKSYIIKVLNTEFNNPINVSKIKNKYDLLKKIKSKYVIKVNCYLEFNNNFSVVLEDFGGIPLSQYINNHCFKLKEFLQVALKITKCIRFIHSKHIIHNNISPLNILYNPHNNMIKLFGFENSSEFSFETLEALNPNIFHDKLYYISPEQTGRMNGPIDYRTDFYSLGITLYELACRKLPFNFTDAADIVYFHMAKTPVFINEINPSFPCIVSKIILKLMEKMPEDRYKSSDGIILDLQECLNQLEEKGIIDEFELGKNDRLDKFEISKKIYGRDKEIKKLLNIFARSVKRGAELVFVSGYSGIGKTAIVNELHKPILKSHGIFLSGKCDQYNKNVPYSALFNALDQFCNYVLSDSEDEVKNWKKKILDSLGDNGDLLIEVIPKLKLIIGNQPKLVKDSIIEVQNKFSIALQNLLKAISSERHPIVFFIDDLQWIDVDSLELFEKIIFDDTIRGLMFICTYRENEVDSTHSLMKSIKRIKKEDGCIEHIHLDNLNVNDISQIIHKVFNCNNDEVYNLAKIIHEKTLGNPFYIIEFLKYCNAKKLIYYNISEKKWMCNELDIKKSKISDNVVVFLIGKIKTLPEATRELILIAACIGNRFDIKILSAISGKSLKKINEDLKPAIDSEMIYVLGKNELNSEKVEFLFCHDKFQQAAYLALEEEKKKLIYRSIANYYETTEGLTNNANLFLVAELYSKLLGNIDNEELIKIINIFLKAAKAARVTSAYDIAKKYLELIINILPQSLKNDDSFIQLLYTEYHLVLFSLADFEEVDKIYYKIEKITKNPLEMVDACCVQLISLSNRSRYTEAFVLGISLLKKLGVIYPENDIEVVIKKEVEKFYLYLQDGSIKKLEKKEMLSDEKDKAIAKLLNRITAASVFFNPLASFWTVLVSVNLMVEKGVTNLSLENLATIALALVPLKNDYYTGYQLSKKLISILEQKGFKEELNRIYHTHSLLNCHWYEPLETAVLYAHKAYKGNVENGEFEFSCFSFFTSQTGILEFCNSIEEMQEEVDAALTFTKQTGNLYSQEAFVSFFQLIKGLKGETFCYGSFNDNDFNEEEYLIKIHDNKIAVFYFYVYKAFLSVIFSDFKKAYKIIKKAAFYLSHVPPAFYIIALFRFLTAISICKSINEEEFSNQKEEMKNLLEENQIWMYQRAKDAPFNFKHLYSLVQAEIKALEGKCNEAFRLYEEAMVEAEQNKRPYHYALICEMTGQKYLEMGIKKTANFYIKEAYLGFQDWKASGKVEWMKKRYREVLFSNSNSQLLSMGYNDLNCIDLKAIINVSQAISSEIETKKLLEKLMEIVIQTSGSTMGHIFLKDENKIILLVSGNLNNNTELIITHKEVDLNHKDSLKILPVSMINYVAMTKEVLIIDNVSASQFIYDNYFESNNIKSAMCLPILQQNTLKGIVYLENNILSGAFNKNNNNIEVLKMISSQAAISIENAFLYSKLERKVKERTLLLEDTISKLKESNSTLEKEIINRKTTEKALEESERQITLSKEYDKIKMEFFSNISHELRTPINVIFSALQIHMFKIKECQYKSEVKDCYKYGHIMKQNCYRILRLINNLIDITKIDSGYISINKTNINIVSLIENITVSVADYIEEKGILLTFDTNVEEKIIACDPEKIEKIILNLLSNSVKFTPRGGNIEVYIHDGIENICIRVKDTGRGIPKEKQDLIFKRFVQVDKSFTRDHEGSGIGLSLVKDLVEIHDGKILLKSSEEHGSEFIIYLPCITVNTEDKGIQYCEKLSKSQIEKINIEFSDIYN
ncbi:AAA family ATPase [Anaerovorax odorimutans]|uniref:AAA family ATPase n=1 Tax=Anaerovorax odorimutans TaxID=109327 RepID=UPI000402D54C|nr:AAA family ATPase [Anaerovorax odorimutans]